MSLSEAHAPGSPAAAFGHLPILDTYDGTTSVSGSNGDSHRMRNWSDLTTFPESDRGGMAVSFGDTGLVGFRCFSSEVRMFTEREVSWARF